MTYRDDLIAEIAALQAKLNVLNSSPEDTFVFGTAVVFDANGVRWYRIKTGEELWRNLTENTEKSLSEWILEAVESNVGYFEVYVLEVQPTPIFASA